MPEALKSMIKGKVSAEYAESHHGKWYKEVVGRESAAKTEPSGQGQQQTH
jgi:cytochrome b subunit of formate dehydrogenase